MRLIISVIASASVMALMSGCVTMPDIAQDSDKAAATQTKNAEAAVFSEGNHPWAAPYLNQLYNDGEWGAVLNFQRLGLVAMENGDFGMAEKAFDEAISRVEEIYAGDENAEKAKSIFNGESVKDYKGEPYERSMLYVYRGLLYVKEQDYQNARASFLAADRHITLSSAESAAYSSDFGLPKYLAAWASSCDGDHARSEHLVSEAQTMDSTAASLPKQPGDLLVLVDSGPAPMKWGDGKYKQILKFKAGEDLEEFSWSIKSSPTSEAYATESFDLVHQATNRGGREVDGILAGKAQFKENAGAIGSTALAIGAQAAVIGAMSGNSDLSGAGLIGLFIGLAATAVEAASTPAADIRGWNNLPEKMNLHTGKFSKNFPKLYVSDSEKNWLLTSESKQCNLAWGRTKSSEFVATEIPRGFDVEGNRAQRNLAMRESLKGMFGANVVAVSK